MHRGAPRIVTLPCLFRHCVYYDNVDQGVFFAGITQDGRFALLEYDNWARDSPFTRDYSLDLETGALTRINLVTTNSAQIYLP